MTGKWRGKKVMVLMGGMSKEREISLRTGTAIAKALTGRGYNVAEVDVTGGRDLVLKFAQIKPDVAVVALHGKFGEDGCVQGFLEMVRVPYTGGGVLASAVGMDKVICSQVARMLGIHCPDEVMLDAQTASAEELIYGLSIPLPVIVKPSREGSTINMTIVKEDVELAPAVRKAAESDTRVIVQSYISGREVTVGVLNGRALPVLEVAPRSGFYDYESKYTKGKTEYIVPARISEESARLCSEWSLSICRAIECEGTARVDFIVNEAGRPYFLEVNTIPGMTELSLVPKAAAHVGLSFEDVCEELLEGARLKIQ